MDVAMVWLALVSACAGVASAVFSFVQARSASNSTTDAQAAQRKSEEARDEALALQREVAEAQAAMAAAAERSAPGQWGPLERTTGQGVSLRNRTGRSAVIESIELAEENTALLYFNHGKLPITVDHDNSFEFMFAQRSSDAEAVITWRFADAPELQEIRRRVPSV